MAADACFGWVVRDSFLWVNGRHFCFFMASCADHRNIAVFMAGNAVERFTIAVSQVKTMLG